MNTLPQFSIKVKVQNTDMKAGWLVEMRREAKITTWQAKDLDLNLLKLGG